MSMTGNNNNCQCTNSAASYFGPWVSVHNETNFSKETSK